MRLQVSDGLVAVLAWANVAAAQDFSRPGVNYTALATDLSKTAEIYQPGSGAFDFAVARWSNLSTPIASVVVVPGNEQDVVKIVR